MLLAGFITVYLPVKVAQSHVSRIGFVAGELHRRLLQLFLRLPSQYPLGNHQRLPVLVVHANQFSAGNAQTCLDASRDLKGYPFDLGVCILKSLQTRLTCLVRKCCYEVIRQGRSRLD